MAGRDLIDKKYYVIIYFIFLFIIAVYLNSMFIEMRDKGYVNTTSLNTLPSAYKEVWYILLTFCFGAFYGANFITWFDKKKTLQGFLIFFASFAVVAEFNYIISLRLEIFLLGAIVSAYVSFKLRWDRGEYKEYPMATKMVSFLVMISALLALANYILGIPKVNESNIYTIFWYFLLTIVFCVIFYVFSRHDVSNSKVFVVGPKAAGKTVFMCGYYEQVLGSNKTIGVATDNLNDALSYMRNGIWPPGTVQNKVYQFNYLQGLLFVNEVEIEAFDYAGEVLEKDIGSIILYLENKSKGQEVASSSDIERIGDGIYNAEKLIFIIDAQRIGMSIEMGDYIKNYYMRIIRLMPRKPYCIVITKSDRFYEKTWGLTDKDYNNLKSKILYEMNKKEPFFKELKKGAADVIPVFFLETKKEKRYLFSWDEIPGNDNGRLIEFLEQNFGIDWVRDAKIEKIDDDRTIRVSTEKNSLSLRLNNEKNTLILKINAGRIEKFTVKMENSKLNAYAYETRPALSEGKFVMVGFDKLLEVLG